MLGSEPIIVTNTNSFCNLTSNINMAALSNNPLVIDQVYDILGREVLSPQVNKIYIVKYTNGSIRKEFWNENRRQ